MMAYFVDCSCRDEVPLFTVFQNLYQLKAQNRRSSSSFYYFTPRKDVKSIISSKCSNLCLNWGKYIRVKCKLVDGYDFPIEWSSPTHESEDSSKEITSLSRKIDQYIDMRAFMLDMHKKRKTSTRATDVVESS
ncbi:hypothetical protein J1N35_041504 [Gossypium stocksii]|uniref:Uncharacterized protein n=1 Tax=Gossypium stocksii TaxID=47602 RepID=A0A9D3ZJH0_9ROSI|nr:hypothetical protein J1N35_041504 [Gossypium stocksii]